MPKAGRTELRVKLFEVLVRACFEAGGSYTEAEVNLRLRKIYDDHVALRRYLVESGFLTRNPDGSLYLVVEGATQFAG